MKKLLEAEAAAAHCGVPVKVLINQAKAREIASVKVGRRKTMFDVADLDAWMARWKRREVTQ